jgi:ATP-dependent RNA helicase DDX55/SPB4
LIKKGSSLKKHDIAALIISPTRELAQQIHYVIEKFLEKINKFTSILFVGGNNVGEDLNKFQTNGGHIVVATAGRLEDILSRQNSSITIKTGFKALEFLILDEADRLLDMGFKESLEIIFKYLPKQRRTGLFSATQTDEIDKLIRAGLRNPCCIQIKQKSNVNSQRTPLELNNFYMVNKYIFKKI